MKKALIVKVCVTIAILCILLLGVIKVVSRVTDEEPKKEVLLKSEETPSKEIEPTETKEDDTEDETVVFDVSEDALNSKSLIDYDSFIQTLFVSNSFVLDVNKDIEESIKSQVSAVAPLSGYISRQVDIQHSGLDESGNYLGILDVFCLDDKSKQYKFTVVVTMSVSKGVVSSFSLSMFQ